jgi:CRISPR-associated protein Csd2
MPINRHDILVFFDVTNGNPNGNPDAGNMPRIEPNTGKGLVSDVCLKRKVRNFVSQFAPQPTGNGGNQFGIFIREGAILNNQINEGEERSAESAALEKLDRDRKAEAIKLDERVKQLEKDAKSQKEKAEEFRRESEKLKKQAKQLKEGVTDNERAQHARDWLCRNYYDVRTFGGVISTGEKSSVMSGSAFGQVRGPVQFTFGMSLDPIPNQEITVTRCAVTNEKDAAKERTMGNKHIVPYALYCAKVFVSPMFAHRTGFDDADLQLFFDALKHLFRDDSTAARAEMSVRAVYDFEHVGTQGENNVAQNRREQQLGCEHAYKLFEKVTFKWKTGAAATGRTFPAEFSEYDPIDGWRGHEDDLLKKGVKLTRVVDIKG